MSSSALRTSTRTFARHASSSAKKRRQPSPPISPDKMRALISLYHQSEHFITPENLLQRIDEEFCGNDKLAHTAVGTISYKDLQNELDLRRSAPKISQWRRRDGAHGVPGSMWSNFKNVRESKVVEALYGTIDAGNISLPGLEVLEEEQAKERQSSEESTDEQETYKFVSYTRVRSHKTHVRNSRSS
ncbi:hypothetical protein PC9H_005238 [Pleurotus ostreatus]|uniref:Uncharacterized protein n=2 Tax=Pleurotus ostreatus TaxID=5322 RepID=A0A067NZQ7_PLEO1|nr:uncharacterized protein PC9H_005238 [Pleurotus ostreatus]KAF7433288.1 hypothetical protein PC9H_005238 [Pleurotus ostreatus]KDQ29111.1 hypothetical protein PLEOSDRAFT_167152 [Pleurotus ostreatus PC15]